MKKKKNLLFLLLIIVSVGVTIAFFNSTAILENIFEAGTYKTITTEVFTSPTNWKPGDVTPKTITTKNEGTFPVRVRVKFDQSWMSANEDELPLYVFEGTAPFWNEFEEDFLEPYAIINFNNMEDWMHRGEYFYYLEELAPGEETSSLIESITFNPNTPSDVTCTVSNDGLSEVCESSGDGYDNATYNLIITTETVQANKYDVIWGNDVPTASYYVGNNPCTYNGELEVGTVYVNGQYTYNYRRISHSVEGLEYVDNLLEDGWNVTLTDLDSTAPVTTTLCSSINNKPIVSMENLFADTEITSVDLSSFDTSNVYDMSRMFSDVLMSTLDLSSFDTSNVKSMKEMFSGLNLNSLDLRGFDTSNVTDMSAIFAFSEFNSILFGDFDTSKVTNMEGMFSGLNSESSTGIELDLSTFDTSNVTNMSMMFWGSNLISLDLSSFDTGNVTSMRDMFARINYMSSVGIELDLSNFDTSNVTDMSTMFWSGNIISLNVSSFDTSSVEDMHSMFAYCSLTSLNITNFNTSNVLDMSNMFSGVNIPVLDLSSFDTSSEPNMRSMFQNALTTTGYAKTQADANKFNSSSNKPAGLTFVVKSS